MFFVASSPSGSKNPTVVGYLLPQKGFDMSLEMQIIPKN
jgi:hypothetical protein